jgi:3-phenylpropionate/trans-cinnamate dioxygenase ferredoxin reductase subunit
MRDCCERRDLDLHPSEFYAERRIQLRTGERVAAVDPAARRVEMESGDVLGYDALVLATGAAPWAPPIEGADLEGVHFLRDLRDCEMLRSTLPAARRAVVVGMGLIGCEVTASLRERGTAVTAVEPQPSPLYAAAGREVGDVIAAVHREHGTELLLGQSVAAITGTERVREVVTTARASLPCDLVVLAVGVRARARLAEEAGLEVDHGIVVDEVGRTSVDGIYAAGDVTSVRDRSNGRLRRFEHWENAREQGRAVGRAILGSPPGPPVVPWFWSDQYDDLKLQWAGNPPATSRTVTRGTHESRSFTRFYLDDDEVVGCLTFNRPRDMRAGRRLIADRLSVNPEQLADEQCDLRQLARGGAPAGVAG